MGGIVKSITAKSNIDHNIENRIYSIKDIQFMLDSDLAELYGVETKRINEAVKNNIDKFPDDFYFELTKEDDEFLRSKFSTFTEILPKEYKSSLPSIEEIEAQFQNEDLKVVGDE
ncbi:ORF6N domain-containing protein [Aliarcobacter cryaerophilus]|uniref:ORF6N domain-containing protein n=1 Tax=Aliarcobacter cryaerophilus TaxID=28198 RepID=UPI0021B45108|nr:ORF6N domain-containing protein [Aliarcobacter cryaerophilus]MCT7495927.1 ORF6N domain-containing protein [Aliarcobacter cryaerophilus]